MNFFKEVSNWFSSIKPQPAVFDMPIQVQQKQNYGQYDILVTDITGRSYLISMGAILSGQKLPKGGWKDVHNNIGPGSHLVLRVMTGDFTNGMSAVNVLRLCSYTSSTM